MAKQKRVTYMERETLLTRTDEGVGAGTFDSIAWAFSEHVETAIGNES